MNALLHRLRLAKSNSIGSARLVSKNQAMLSICDSQEEVAALKCALSRAQKYSICHDHEEKLLQVVKAELLKR